MRATYGSTSPRFQPSYALCSCSIFSCAITDSLRLPKPESNPELDQVRQALVASYRSRATVNSGRDMTAQTVPDEVGR
jgi:hypothetical protein